MMIRAYMPSDEQGWLRCRVISFLDCSYWNDVKTSKERYSHPTVSLVAQERGQIVGLLDVELDSDDIAYPDCGRGAVLWHMAVLPEYRRQGIAAKLWKEAEKRLIAEGITYCELWTQEDDAANRFYRAMGFTQQVQNSWLRCYAKWDDCYDLLDKGKTGEIYGVEEVVFQAALSRKEALSKKCYRIDEVRLYSKRLERESCT